MYNKLSLKIRFLILALLLATSAALLYWELTNFFSGFIFGLLLALLGNLGLELSKRFKNKETEIS